MRILQLNQNSRIIVSLKYRHSQRVSQLLSNHQGTGVSFKRSISPFPSLYWANLGPSDLWPNHLPLPAPQPSTLHPGPQTFDLDPHSPGFCIFLHHSLIATARRRPNLWSTMSQRSVFRPEDSAFVWPAGFAAQGHWSCMARQFTRAQILHLAVATSCSTARVS